MKVLMWKEKTLNITKWKRTICNCRWPKPFKCCFNFKQNCNGKLAVVYLISNNKYSYYQGSYSPHLSSYLATLTIFGLYCLRSSNKVCIVFPVSMISFKTKIPLKTDIHAQETLQGILCTTNSLIPPQSRHSSVEHGKRGEKKKKRVII